MIAHATPPPIICEPDVLCAVVRETARSGWPHLVTRAELVAVVRRVDRHYLARAVSCGTLGSTIARVSCGVVGRRRTFEVRVRVWEDGSYRITRMGGK